MSKLRFIGLVPRSGFQCVAGARRFAVLVFILITACVGGWRVHALTINPTFSGTIPTNARAAAIMYTIHCAIAEYEAAILDSVVVSIDFMGVTNGLGGSSYAPLSNSYSGFRTALVSRATSSQDITALASVPDSTNNPVNGTPVLRIGPTPARMLGLTTNAAAGTIFLNTSSCNIDPETDNDSSLYSLFAVVCHEIDEVLGGGGGGGWMGGTNGTPAPTDACGPMELFRYAVSGANLVRSFDTEASTVSYFCLDGTFGTILAQFNQNGKGDYTDFATGSTPLIQDAFGTRGAQQVMAVEWNMLDILGYRWNGHTNVWCNFIPSSGAGTVYSPKQFSDALASVAPGGVILMKPGFYFPPGRISTACKLKAVNGTARIQ